MARFRVPGVAKPDEVTNSMSGRARWVVQAGSINNVIVRGGRAWPLIGALLVALAAVGGIWGWTTLSAPSVPLSVTSTQHADVGWVVPDRSDDPIPLERDKQPPGGVAAISLSVSMTVHGLTDEAVVLEGVRLEIVARRTPTKGALLWTGPICPCDLLPVRHHGADLDAPTPAFEFHEGEDDSANFPYKISSTAPEKIAVSAVTSRATSTGASTCRGRPAPTRASSRSTTTAPRSASPRRRGPRSSARTRPNGCEPRRTPATATDADL